MQHNIPAPVSRRSDFAVIWLGLVALALVTGVARAQAPFPVQDLAVKGVYAEKADDPTIYCLVGGHACSPPQGNGVADSFIARWVLAHPDALVVPISTQTLVLPPKSQSLHEVYFWIESGGDSLNLALVREGFYPSQAMTDMVDEYRRLSELQRTFAKNINPGNSVPLLPLWGPSETEAANKPRRLVSDSDYAQRMGRIAAAEKEAKLEKKGIWSERPGDVASVRVDEETERAAFPARDLYATGVAAHRMGHPGIYCLVGGDSCVSGFTLLTSSEKERKYIAAWLAAHPNATATPISTESRKVLTASPAVPSTYVWIEDHEDSLTLSLVSEGFYRAQALTDMVEQRQAFDAMLRDSKLADAHTQIEKERATEKPPLRLVSDADYARRMGNAVTAEQEAMREKKGLWSDEQIKTWKPPSDAQLINSFEEHRSLFRATASLVRAEPRLAQLSRNPKSWKAVRDSGVPQGMIDEYVGILTKLDANETLSGVYGLGKACLIRADIVYGLVDTGIIKGYVLAPYDPKPLVKDLENWPADAAEATTAYRPISDGWYLFELHH